MTFAQSGVVLEKNKRAGIEGTCLVGCSRALMSVANLTVPLWFMRFFEKNMAFFTPLKGIIFTGTSNTCFSLEITLIESCLLTPVAMGLITPIGTVKADVPVYPPIEDEESEPVEPTFVKEDVYYFRGYYPVFPHMFSNS